MKNVKTSRALTEQEMQPSPLPGEMIPRNAQLQMRQVGLKAALEYGLNSFQPDPLPQKQR